MPTNTPTLCRYCGRALPADAPKGYCPGCLLRLLGSEVGLTRDPHHTLNRFSATAPVPVPAIETMRRFGDYELLGEIASGGMGVVYLARQVRLNRTVALKMIRSGQLATAAEIQRFKREAEAAAALDHPNIVPIHEIGEADGRPYFSMQLMEGGNLAEALLDRNSGFSVRATSAHPDWEAQIARLVATVARAVHHAHQRGVLHRDLKPTNILLDDAGEPHLTDFGLAKWMDGPAVTQSLAVIGTPAYMAPEQAAGNSRQLTTAVDIYSLGAILYELLGGQPPFIGDSAVAILAQVKDREPEPLLKRHPRVDRDLATIAHKCLEKNPEARYPSALALAEDLERHLRGESIQARAAPAAEKLWRWCRRQPALAAALGALGLALLAGFAGIFTQWRRAERNAGNEASQRQRAEEAVFRLTFEKAETRFDQDRASQGIADLARLLRQYPTNGAIAARLQSALSLRSFCLPVAAITHGRELTQLQLSPDGARVLTASHDGVARVSEATDGRPVQTFQHAAAVDHAVFSPDGKQIVTACRDGTARVWSVATGQPIGEPLRHAEAVGFAIFSPDGRRIVTASRDKTARVWDAVTGQAVSPPMIHARTVRSARFSPDGRRVVTVAEAERVRRAEVQVWDADSGQAVGPSLKNTLQFSAQFTPDGSGLWIGNDTLFDAATGKLQHQLPGVGEWSMHSSEFSRDGATVLTASQDSSARLWHWKSAQPLPARMLHEHFVIHASFSGDGEHVVTASRDTTVRLWNTAGNSESEPLRHTAPLRQAFANSNSTRIITRPGGREAWIWERHAGPGLPTFSHDAGLLWAAFTRDGQRLVTTSQDHTARLWEVATGRMLTTPLPHFGWINHAEWSPDESVFATGAQDGVARIWDPTTGKVLRRVRHRDHVRRVLFSPDGSRLFTGSYDFTVQIWNAATAERVGKTMTHPQRVQSIQLSPDGRRLLTTSQEGTARIWDAATGEPLIPPVNAGVLLLNARFTPDGRRFVTVANDRTARVWDAVTGRPLGAPVEHQDEVAPFSPDFSADGRLVLTAAGNTARIWDIETGVPVGEAMTHNSAIRSAWFSPNKQMVATTSADRTARLWDAAQALPISEPLRHAGAVPNAFFTPDGRFLLTLGDDAKGRLWAVPILTEPVPAWLPEFAEAVAGMRINDRNMYVVVPPSNFVELRARLAGETRNGEWADWLKSFLNGSGQSRLR